MTHATDPHALAETLRHWALRFLAALLELFDRGPFARPQKQAFRRWAATMLTRAERGVMALVLLIALRKAPYMPPPLKRAARPLSGPHGFRCRATRETRVAQMTRGLFPKARNLIARARRLVATLANLDAAARPVLRRLLRTPLMTVLVAVAPPATPLSSRATDTASAAHDTS